MISKWCESEAASVSWSFLLDTKWWLIAHITDVSITSSKNEPLHNFVLCLKLVEFKTLNVWCLALVLSYQQISTLISDSDAIEIHQSLAMFEHVTSGIFDSRTVINGPQVLDPLSFDHWLTIAIVLFPCIPLYANYYVPLHLSLFWFETHDPLNWLWSCKPGANILLGEPAPLPVSFPVKRNAPL